MRDRSRRAAAGLCLVLLAVLAIPGIAVAQRQAERRHGVWFMLGLGYGSAAIKCDGCASDHDPGFAGTFGFGGTVSEHLLLGVESNWWTREDNDLWRSMGVVTGTAYYFPRRDMGLFLKAGVGGAGYHSISGYGPDPDQFGLGLLGGAGYEIPLGWTVSVVPTVTYHWGTMFGEGTPTGITQDMWMFTLALYAP